MPKELTGFDDPTGVVDDTFQGRRYHVELAGSSRVWVRDLSATTTPVQHAIRYWFPDATARAAGTGATITATEVTDNIVYGQVSDNTLWRPTNHSPLTWTRVAGEATVPPAITYIGSYQSPATPATLTPALGAGYSADDLIILRMATPPRDEVYQWDGATWNGPFPSPTEVGTPCVVIQPYQREVFYNIATNRWDDPYAIAGQTQFSEALGKYRGYWDATTNRLPTTAESTVLPGVPYEESDWYLIAPAGTLPAPLDDAEELDILYARVPSADPNVPSQWGLNRSTGQGVATDPTVISATTATPLTANTIYSIDSSAATPTTDANGTFSISIPMPTGPGENDKAYLDDMPRAFRTNPVRFLGNGELFNVETFSLDSAAPATDTMYHANEVGDTIRWVFEFKGGLWHPIESPASVTTQGTGAAGAAVTPATVETRAIGDGVATTYNLTHASGAYPSVTIIDAVSEDEVLVRVSGYRSATVLTVGPFAAPPNNNEFLAIIRPA